MYYESVSQLEILNIVTYFLAILKLLSILLSPNDKKLLFFLNNLYKKQWQSGTGVGEVGAGHFCNRYKTYLVMHLLSGCDSVLNTEKCEIRS